MPALADLQASVRGALLGHGVSTIAPLLVGGREPLKRLAIHQRHYAASLVHALLERFPATIWLVGSELVTAAAQAFVLRCPPSRPCIAEYGEDFPAFLSARPGAAQSPYLRQFAELEWHLGRLSLAIESPPVRDLSMVDRDHLFGTPLTIQPSVRYLHLDWPLDELMSMYLTDSAPDTYSLVPGDVWLELRGVRGQLRMSRITHAALTFRSALTAAATLGDAATSALAVNPAFEAGAALAALLSEGLVAEVGTPRSVEVRI